MKKTEEKKELEVLLKAIELLNYSTNTSEVFYNLLDSIKEIALYDNAFILIKKKEKMYKCLYSTDLYLEGRTWFADEFFDNLHINGATITKDVSELNEWQEQFDLYSSIRSAVHIPIRGKTHNAIMICVKKRDNFFDQKQLNIINKFLPIVNHTLSLLEVQKNLEVEIKEREKAEREKSKLNQQLIESAYKEGFAENAISVLHNIGNLLTPLKVKIETNNIEKQFDTISEVLEKIVSLDTIESKNNTINKLKEIILSEKIQIHDFVTFCRDQSIKIADTISSQQKYANLKSNIAQRTNLKEILIDIIQSMEMQFKKFNINIVTEINGEVEVLIDKNGIHHALMNSIKNSIEAITERIKESGDFEDKSIYISLEKRENKAFIQIIDTGIGFTKEKENLFNFGFTTKETGSGFGLHSCSNFIKSNNGSIILDSAGKNRGAQCKISIPIIDNKGSKNDKVA